MLGIGECLTHHPCSRPVNVDAGEISLGTLAIGQGAIGLSILPNEEPIVVGVNPGTTLEHGVIAQNTESESRCGGIGSIEVGGIGLSGVKTGGRGGE